MESEKNMQNMQATFFTQVKQSRPQTSYIARNRNILQHQLALDPQIDPSTRLKRYRQQIKKLQLQYQHTLTRLNQSKKVIDKNYRESQKKKVQFLNLYDNRKVKIHQQKLLEGKQHQQDKTKTELRERAKTMKLNTEIRSLLIKNELQENNNQLCNKNKHAKQNIRQQISHKREKDYEKRRNSFTRIKATQIELQDRRKRLEEMQAAMGKQNYFKKIQNELSVIDNIDKLLNQVCEERNVCDNCPGGKSFFVTDKLE